MISCFAKIVRINISKIERQEAEKISVERNLPFTDCVLALQSRDHDAVLISQDKHIINQLKDIARVMRPDEFS